MSVNEKAKEFAQALRETKEYIELKKARKSIDTNRAVKSKIDQFRKREQALYSQKKSGKDIKAEADELGKMYENLSRIPEVENFLKAEKGFNDVLAKAYKAVNDSIEAGMKSR